jgi:hypothetical protein
VRFAGLLVVLVAGSARADRAGALDELPLDGQAQVAVDVEHADASDAVAIVPALRLAFAEHGFLSLALPAGWHRQTGTTVLGDATATIGAAYAGGAIAVRVGAPTAPSLGDAGRAATALATPRVADPELFLPATTSIELVADRRWNRQTTWLQLEGGAMARWIGDAEAVARVSVAGGVAVESWLDLSASFVTRVTFHPDTEHFVHSLVLGAIVHVPRVGQLAVRIDVPIDDSARADNRFVAGATLTY